MLEYLADRPAGRPDDFISESMTSRIVYVLQVIYVAHYDSEMKILTRSDPRVHGLRILGESILILDAGKLIEPCHSLYGLKVLSLLFLSLILIFDILDAAEDMLFIFTHDICLTYMRYLAFRNDTVDHRVGTLGLEPSSDIFLIVEPDLALQVIRMNVLR